MKKKFVVKCRPRKVPSFSYSSLSDFQVCPLSYYLARIRGRTPVLSPYLLRGSLLHDAALLYSRAQWKTPKGKAEYHDWEECVRGAVRRSDKQPDLETMAEVKALMANFASAFQIDRQNLIGVEVPLAFDRSLSETGWETKGVWFRMKLDQLWIRGEYALVEDLKSSIRIGSADPFQNMTYAWGVLTQYPQVYEVHTQFNYVRWEYITPPVVYTRDMLPDIHADMLARCEKIEKCVEWPARLGLHCSGCGVRAYCPEIKRGSRYAAFDYPSDPRTLKLLVDKYLHAAAQAGEAYAVLREFADNAGDFRSSGHDFQWGSSLTWKGIEAGPLAKALEEKSIDPMLFLKPNIKAIRGLDGGDGLLDSLGQRKVTTALRVKEVKRGEMVEDAEGQTEMNEREEVLG